MTECEKEAYQILRNVLWLNEEDHEELYEEFILAVSHALQKKQDEIEQYKTQWQNAEDSNIKLSENIAEYRKEIDRLKNQNVVDCGSLVCPFEKKSIEQAQEIERLKDDLSRAERELSAQTYRGNSIGYIYDKMLAYQGQVYPMACSLKELGFDYSNSGKDNSERESSLKEWTLKKLEEIQSLTALNKERVDEIERLKKECELWRSEFNRIQELDISNFDTWTKYDLQREVTRLTARNKELESDMSLMRSDIADAEERIKELENYPLRVRAEKAEAQMEIYRLETIRWKEAYEPLKEKYKELESKLRESKESHTAGQRMRLCEKIHFLESKIAAAREVLKVFAERNPENDPCQPLAKKALAELGEKP